MKHETGRREGTMGTVMTERWRAEHDGMVVTHDSVMRPVMNADGTAMGEHPTGLVALVYGDHENPTREYTLAPRTRLIAEAPAMADMLERLVESHARLEHERGSVVGTLTYSARKLLARLDGAR